MKFSEIKTAEDVCNWLEDKRTDPEFMTDFVNLMHLAEQIVIAKSNVGPFWKVLFIGAIEKRKYDVKSMERAMQAMNTGKPIEGFRTNSDNPDNVINFNERRIIGFKP